MASLQPGVERREQWQLITPLHRPEFSLPFHLDRCDRLGLLTKAPLASVRCVERHMRQRSTILQRSTRLSSPFHEASRSCSINCLYSSGCEPGRPTVLAAAESTQVRALWGPEEEGQEPQSSEGLVCWIWTVQRRKEVVEGVWFLGFLGWGHARRLSHTEAV